MYNPQFKEFNTTLKYLADKHCDYLQSISVKWQELKDEDGDVYQIVPLIDIKYK